jgi:SRSO17 transposase
MGKRFIAFCEGYASHFQLKTRNIEPQAQHYLCGLMQTRRKNMERMAEVIPDSDEQALQHFLSNSNWDERKVLDQVALEANQLIGGKQNSALLIDESGFTKKGKHSVGVARQYNGRLGKVDNCQVGVFASLNHRKQVTLIDQRLYLPEHWTEDPERCESVGIPEANRSFKTKPELTRISHPSQEKRLFFTYNRCAIKQL